MNYIEHDIHPLVIPMITNEFELMTLQELQQLKLNHGEVKIEITFEREYVSISAINSWDVRSIVHDEIQPSQQFKRNVENGKYKQTVLFHHQEIIVGCENGIPLFGTHYPVKILYNQTTYTLNQEQLIALFFYPFIKSIEKHWTIQMIHVFTKFRNINHKRNILKGLF